jgi:hypothetical protein
MPKLYSYSTLIFVLFSTFHANAQKLRLKDYSVGYRIFEIDAVGNNPTTISPLLKEPVAYDNYFANIKYNSLWGNPEILHLNTFYVNAEWYRHESASRFWKKHTIQAGLLLTSKITKWAGAVADERYYSPDTISHVYKYSVTQNLQFFGANAGVNRRFTISKKLEFIAGLQAQGSFALVHRFRQQWDSSAYTPGSGWKTNNTQLPNIKGKNFFQWQVMVPLGLEYALYKKKFFIRLEVNAGIVGSKYRPKTASYKEAHGAGIWFIYQPN